MLIKVQRLWFLPTYTIGRLYIDDVFCCNTLEDTYRDLSKEPKIDKFTAIPYGTYKMVINYSEKFQCLMPLILDVPQFEGVRIHSGNTSKDTDSCILLGKNNVKGMVTNSQFHFKNFLKMLGYCEDMKIEINGVNR